jgi:hypothetical protein
MAVKCAKEDVPRELSELKIKKTRKKTKKRQIKKTTTPKVNKKDLGH